MAGRTRKVSFYHYGLWRNFYYYVPYAAFGRPLPMLVALHGGGGTAEQIKDVTTGLFRFRFNELADRHGCVVVYPNGYERNWNDGRTNGATEALRLNVDDVGFIDRLVGKVLARTPIDRQRIWVGGLSNGGTMTLRLIQESETPWAAAAICIASLPVERYQGYVLKHRLPVLVMNGTADPFIPWGGGVGPAAPGAGAVIPTPSLVYNLVAQNDARTDALSELIPNTSRVDGVAALKFTYEPDSEEGRRVVFYEVTNSGHTIPNRNLLRPPGTAIFGPCCQDFTAVDHIWEFFSQS